MQNNEIICAKKALKAIGPFLNYTKLAALCGCHTNTIINYTKGQWGSDKLGMQIFEHAKTQFLALNKDIQGIIKTHNLTNA